MAVQRTHKQSDLEKRLKLLNMQLYGKKSENNSKQLRKTQQTSNSEYQINRNSDTSDTPSHSESFRNDITYLRQDLFKILVLGTLALVAELAIYYSNIYNKSKLF